MTGLEALEVIAGDSSYYDEETFYYNIEIIEKSLKALEIIKEKNVDVHWMKIINDLEAYNEDKNAWEKELTTEEFDLLKEVLE